MRRENRRVELERKGVPGLLYAPDRFVEERAVRLPAHGLSGTGRGRPGAPFRGILDRKSVV